jgi:sulfotransferase family protein
VTNPWHAFVDSDSLRWFTKRGPGRPIMRSRAFRRLDLHRRRVRAARATQRDSRRFERVQTFCCFVGHNKSGTSMLGALLDAHAEIVLADEVDALRYVDAGFGRDELFHVLERGARSEARKGRVTARRLVPYSYAVPGQYQGRSVAPRVVGDSTSGTSTRRLGADPGLLEQCARLMPGVDVRLIQVIRNPFDPISAMMVRGKRTFENAIDHYFTACNALLDIRRRAGASLLPVRYEDFVADPVGGLRAVCGFVGVAADDDYLQACAAIIRPVPDRSRDMVAWDQPWIGRVERRIDEFDFLAGYSYAT